MDYIVNHDENAEPVTGSFAPYNPILFPEFDWMKSSAFLLDHWSLGVIIMEVLLGPEMVLSCECHSAIEMLLKDCEEYLDQTTVDLLKYLLFSEGKVDLPQYIEKTLDAAPMNHAENIRRIQMAST